VKKKDKKPPVFSVAVRKALVHFEVEVMVDGKLTEIQTAKASILEAEFDTKTLGQMTSETRQAMLKNIEKGAD